MVTLFDHGVDVNASDRDGSTALMLASLHGSGLDVVNSLLDHGADVNAKNKFGNTALTLTVGRGRKYRESGGI
jgi:ankyrin repeat protein